MLSVVTWQAVQKVELLHEEQELSQGSQVLAAESAKVSAGQVETHWLAYKKAGVEQLVQVVALKEHVRQGEVQA